MVIWHWVVTLLVLLVLFPIVYAFFKRPGLRKIAIAIVAIGAVSLFAMNIFGRPPLSPPIPRIDDNQLRARAEPFDFEEAARNPQRCTGKLVKGEGKVIQVREETGSSVTLRVNVTKTYDSIGETWDDTILVRYQRRSTTEPRVLRNDVISFFGQCQGDVNYTSVLGASVTIPEVDAQIVTFNDSPLSAASQDAATYVTCITAIQYPHAKGTPYHAGIRNDCSSVVRIEKVVINKKCGVSERRVIEIGETYDLRFDASIPASCGSSLLRLDVTSSLGVSQFNFDEADAVSLEKE